MYVENANRAAKDGVVTLENYEPNPKNPIIASFFRNIGLADELGSGVRNLYKYGRRYSDGDPKLIDGDAFRVADAALFISLCTTALLALILNFAPAPVICLAPNRCRETGKFF
jgi:hypothetical protein